MLKIFADECINTNLILAIKNSGFYVLSTKEAGLTGASDEEVFDFAIEKDLIIFTSDRGFGDIFRFNIGNSCGVVIVLIDQMTQEEIINVTVGFFNFIKESGIEGKLAIIGKNKIRIVGR